MFFIMQFSAAACNFFLLNSLVGGSVLREIGEVKPVVETSEMPLSTP
jgi:hypothetical protein